MPQKPPRVLPTLPHTSLQSPQPASLISPKLLVRSLPIGPRPRLPSSPSTAISTVNTSPSLVIPTLRATYGVLLLAVLLMLLRSLALRQLSLDLLQAASRAMLRALSSRRRLQVPVRHRLLRVVALLQVHRVLLPVPLQVLWVFWQVFWHCRQTSDEAFGIRWSV